MKRVIPVFLLTTIAAFIAAQPCSELFFSEYMEGTSNNKALEIFNPTTMPVNLAGYKVQLYTNGSSAVQTTLNLSGTVAPGDVYVIVNPQANATVKANRDTSSGVTNFNGNDAIALVKGTASIDIIGQIGVDPGASGWMLSGGG
ncbi:MAG TPA: lamin tail domain-containing protein, partial [Chitinophagales bacterium]|nr:lamin tail domain-containing protein [Chitinophagales bacterium]